MKKQISVPKVLNSLRSAVKVKMRIKVNIIIGYPEENLFSSSINSRQFSIMSFIYKILAANVAVFDLSPLTSVTWPAISCSLNFSTA